MVALGAGITSTRDEPIGTTLNQTLLHGPVLIDGHAVQPGESKVPQTSWVLHDEVGYTFLGPADASIKVGPQTGDWKPISTANRPTPVTERCLRCGLTMACDPQDAQYAYAVLPGINAQQLAEWVARPPVRVISNTTAQQAVINDQTGVAEIVFYTAGSVALASRLGGEGRSPVPGATGQTWKLNARRGVESGRGIPVPVHLTLTTLQGEKRVTFELPGGDEAGKSQVIDVNGPLAGVFSPSAKGR